MNEETKALLTKLFRKYQTIGAVSGIAYLTEKDYNFLIHDKSFPVDCQVMEKNAEDMQKICCMNCRHFRSEDADGYPYEYCSELNIMLYDIATFYCQKFESNFSA